MDPILIQISDKQKFRNHHSFRVLYPFRNQPGVMVFRMPTEEICRTWFVLFFHFSIWAIKVNLSVFLEQLATPFYIVPAAKHNISGKDIRKNEIRNCFAHLRILQIQTNVFLVLPVTTPDSLVHSHMLDIVMTLSEKHLG